MTEHLLENSKYRPRRRQIQGSKNSSTKKHQNRTKVTYRPFGFLTTIMLQNNLMGTL